MTSTPGSAGPTDAVTPPPSEPARRIARFTRAERWVHRATAALALLCVATAAALYVPQLAELVGRRYLVVTVHEWAGILLPAPFLLGLASPAFRADLRRLNRFGPHDRRWLRAVRRRDRRRASRPAGKFNAGQKIYASWIAGAVLVMMATGLLMWFTHLTPLVWRTSATFVHDWLALAIGVVLIGHIRMALADPEARRGMRTGSVERPWVEREHPLWLAGEDEDEPKGERAQRPESDAAAE
ncbi:cytochrome b/b6 domain-containing protein [Streptomyces sp. NPDC089795]|uniref:cytochrome b/b6 domain-containing protein n=1 Tax=Streptomyces sp. NPDC089795 TaxID=3155297 RepID=UPI00344A8942